MNVQNNKYTPNPLPEIVVPRNELIAHLNKAAEQKQLFVSAPAGSGKTIMTLLWIKKSHRHAIFIGLDNYDNFLAIFYKVFCTGILSVQPDNSAMQEILKSRLFNVKPIEHTIMLLSEFASDEKKYLLVLDDFHSITNPEILKSLPYILRRLPHSFTTIFLSRTEPEAYLSASMKDHPAVLISADRLSFSTHEIGELFRLRGKSLSAKEAESAFAFTGGWAIAVNALSLSGATALEHFDLGTLIRYAWENVWPNWDEATRTFMILSAVIDEIPVLLCEQITGRSDTAIFLEQLRRQNAYLTRTQDDVYRFHHLFLEAIRCQTEYHELSKTDIWHTAALYYLNKGDIFKSLNYAYKSKNLKTILNILDAHRTFIKIPINEYANNLDDLSYSEVVKELCEENPVLLGSYAYMFFIIGDARNFEINMDKLIQNLPMIAAEYPIFAESAVPTLTLDYRIPLKELCIRINEMPSAIFEDNEIKKITYSFQMPFLHRAGRDLCELADPRIYEEWIKSNQRVLKDHYQVIIKSTIAGIYYEQNRLSEALNEIQAAIDELSKETAKEIRLSVYLHLAAIYQALDKKAEFEMLVEKAANFINQGSEFLRPNFLAFKTLIKLLNGEVSAAKEWLRNHFVYDNERIEPYKLYQYFTTVRSFIVIGELEKAKTLARQIRKMAHGFKRPQDAAEAGVLISAVLWAEGKKEEAQEMMEAILIEMQPYSFIRVIADEGAAVLQLIKKISGKTEHENYSGPLKANYVNSIYMVAYAVSKRYRGIMAELKTKPIKLSPQQKKLLGLLAQGYKRDGIVEKTGLSLSTVKSYLNITYHKLEVDNAVEAVLKAQELGLIEL